MLKLAHCGDSNCSSGNSIVTVPTPGDVPSVPSLELDSSGNPVISYSDAPSRDVKLVRCGDDNCAIVTIERVDPIGVNAANSSLALDAVGFPVVAYVRDNQFEKGLDVTRCSDANCAGDDESTEELDVGIMGAVSLMLDSSGNPVASYHFDWFSGANDLKLAHCVDPDCTGVAPSPAPMLGSKSLTALCAALICLATVIIADRRGAAG